MNLHSSPPRGARGLFALFLVVLASCKGGFSLNGSSSSTQRAGTSSSSGDSSSGDSSSASSGDQSAAHDRFAVLDLKIGMPLDGHDGFVCTAAEEGEDRHCVKFLDKRCAGQATNVGELEYGEQAPLGCFLDHSGFATKLDDKLMQTANNGLVKHPDPHRLPLINVHLVGTQSSPSRIYRIVYTLAVDDLEKDSKLYRTLVDKYGEPSEIHGWVAWRAEDTELRASCAFDFCSVDVADSHFEEVENRRQKEIDDRARHDNTPAPDL